MALSASNNGPAPAALMAYELMARGRESAAALEALLQAQGASRTSALAQHHGVRELAEQILCCLDRALAALHGKGVIDTDATGDCPSKKRRLPPGAGAQAKPKRRSRLIDGEMPTRVEKRGTPEDGFLWRKYGQKEIVNSKYQRTYFRCAYKHDNGCKATRQVQQSEDDPSVYIVTYFGEHICGMDAATAVPVGQDKKSPQLVINFGSGAANSGSPWLSCSDDDVLRNFSPEEDGGQQQACNVCNSIESSVVLAPSAEPSSSADVSCPSPDLDPLLHYFYWDDCCGGSFFDTMESVNFEAALFQ